MFQRPVEIGSLLFLSAMVVYVEGNKIQTRVHAEVVDLHTAKRETTNVFYFIFKTKDHSPLQTNVVPKTYAGKLIMTEESITNIEFPSLSLFSSRGNDVFGWQTTSQLN